MSQSTENNTQDFLAGKQQDAVRRLFSHVLRYKKWLAVALCAMVVTAGSSSLIALLVGQLTDKGFYEKDPTAIWWAPGSLLVISLAYGLSSFTSSLFLQKISQDVLYQFRTQLFSRVLKWPAATEKRTFSYVCESFTEFAKRIESLCSSHTQKVENWLDSQEVCLLLGLSKRTLQYYRSSGRLAYSQIGSKIYYKSSDIERIIADSETQNQSPKQTTPYEKN